jgi:transposase-like protein
MVRQYRKFDGDFKAGAVRLVFETGKPIAQVARDLGINEGTLGNWVTTARRQRDGGDGPVERGRARGAGPAAPGERRAADAA